MNFGQINVLLIILVVLQARVITITLNGWNYTVLYLPFIRKMSCLIKYINTNKDRYRTCLRKWNIGNLRFHWQFKYDKPPLELTRKLRFDKQTIIILLLRINKIWNKINNLWTNENKNKISSEKKKRTTKKSLKTTIFRDAIIRYVVS